MIDVREKKTVKCVNVQGQIKVFVVYQILHEVGFFNVHRLSI